MGGDGDGGGVSSLVSPGLELRGGLGGSGGCAGGPRSGGPRSGWARVGAEIRGCSAQPKVIPLLAFLRGEAGREKLQRPGAVRVVGDLPTAACPVGSQWQWPELVPEWLGYGAGIAPSARCGGRKVALVVAFGLCHVRATLERVGHFGGGGGAEPLKLALDPFPRV